HNRVAVGFMLALALAISATAQELTDPYQILERHFQALGGLERLKAEKATYTEGTLALGPMQGTVKAWSQQPYRNRSEMTLGPLAMTQGDNGQFQWVLDQNGKVQKMTNPEETTARRRQVRQLMAEYAYADPASQVFKVSFEGVDSADGKKCYIVKITNNINLDYYFYCIDTVTFMQDKAFFIEDVESRAVIYRDYREIGGLKVPFWTQDTQHQTGQILETKLTQYISNPTIESSQFEPPEEGVKDYEFVDGTCAENIPFKYIGGHLFIPVNTGGKERPWVLDTGASMTVLNRAFAEELGLELEGSMKGREAGGVAEATFTKLPPFRIANIQFQGQTVAVIDMSDLIRLLGVEIVGVLGYDFLARYVTKVDFADELVSFYAPEKFEYTGIGNTIDIHIQNSLFEVPAILDGVHSGTWLFDLGAGGTFLDGCYALREGYANRKGKLGMGHGATKVFQNKSVLCDSLQFAGFTVYKPEIDFSYGGSDTVFTADQIGVLGNSIFRNFVIYVDYSGERLIVEKGGKFNQPWAEDHSGLQIAWTPDRTGVEVVYVSPDSPADKAGFAKGDLVRSINGINVKQFDGVLAVR
ncbi:MAG: aspartyl protease family protein, partial [candidate division Zixibacteria bacterium]|nr:aspartyl protease family protein [candidate division Zixibacteria bacterium]